MSEKEGRMGGEKETDVLRRKEPEAKLKERRRRLTAVRFCEFYREKAAADSHKSINEP